MNIANRTLFIADNLDIMRGMDSEIIDLIYLDPPFNKKKKFKAPIGSPAEGAEFKDIWIDEDVKDGWFSEIAELYPHIHQIIQAAEHTYDHSMMIYLMSMGIRLIEMHRILKPTGSIYLHCDPTASHYLKLIMDDVFGKNNFRNEIVWSYRTGGSSTKSFSSKHDIILFYVKSSKIIFNLQKEKSYTKSKLRKPGIINYGGGTKEFFEDECGVFNWVNMRDIWDISYIGSTSPERTGYPTQKPLELLDRIIKASSNKGDMVLDPFCGCATACVSAEKLQRQWIGIDISPSAEVITKIRLEEASERGSLFSPISMSDVTVTSTPPIRTDEIEPRQLQLPNYKIHKNDLYGKQAGNCSGCKRHFEIQNFTVDHINPVSKGGTDHPKNLQLLCPNCNSTKGNRDQEYLV